MTRGSPDLLLAVRQACEVSGLDPAGARLIHHYSNAIYVLPAEDVVARVTYGRDSAERVARSLAVTRWLAGQGFAATEPYAGTGPVAAAGAVVSFWTYYPQPAAPAPMTSAHLAVLLLGLHQAGAPPFPLPAWVPLESLEATVDDRVLSAALTGDEREWIVARIGEMRGEIEGLDWPLGSGLIHGDAWAGNLLSCPAALPAGVLLGDWDWVSTGPREVDLIPTWHAAVRYGKSPSWVADFVTQYGYDLAGWEGYRVMLAMRDLLQLSGPIRRAPASESHRQALRQRLDGLRSGDTASAWKAL